MERLRYLIAQSLPLLLLLAALIYAISFIPSKWDVTADRLYSLNPQTQTILDELPGEVRIQVFMSEDLPPRFAPVAGLVRDLLAAYERDSHGKVQVDYIDPDSDAEDTKRAQQLGIERTRANVFSDNRLETVQLWFGMSLHYDAHNEVIPIIGDVGTFEYDTSAALLRLTRQQKRKLLLVGPTYAEGTGVVFDIRKDMKVLKREWDKHFDVNQIRLTPETDLDLHDADAVLIWSLATFTETQLYAVDQYLVAGGSLMLMATGMRVDPNVLLAQAVPRSRADQFYAHLGFHTGQDLIADSNCTKIKYTDSTPPVLADYPLFPSLSHATGALDAKHPVTRELQKLVIPWPSSLKALDTGIFRPEVIATTSDQSWSQTENYVIDPQTVPGPTRFSQFNLGLHLEGHMVSFFQTAPAGISGEHQQRAQNPCTILVWGSEHLLTQTRDSSAINWAMRSVGFLTERGTLSGIDRRSGAFRPLRKLEVGEQSRIKWLSVLPIPILLLLLALVRALLRRRRNLDYLTQTGEAS